MFDSESFSAQRLSSLSVLANSYAHRHRCKSRAKVIRKPVYLALTIALGVQTMSYATNETESSLTSFQFCLPADVSVTHSGTELNLTICFQ